MNTNTSDLMFYRRQGDWLFKPSQAVPDGLHQIKSNVVGEGEGTGHLHQFTTGQVVLYANSKGETEAVEVVSDKATLTHPEHGPIEFEKGLYCTRKEIDYNPFTEEMQRVKD